MKKRNKPDADLANVAYELSSKGRNTILTTKLPGLQQSIPLKMLFTLTCNYHNISLIKIAKDQNQ